MRIDEFKEEIKILAVAYPNVFPADPKERGAAAIIWYDHFSYIPQELFTKASKWCRQHEQFLSIAALWRAIIAVADVPTPFEIRKELDVGKFNMHPMSKRIYKALDLHWEDAELTDFAFEREYKRALEWWIERIMQPENVGLLTGGSQPLLGE